MKSFDNEVRYQVGQRVVVDLKEVPKEHRNCEVGVIVNIFVRFAATPEVRKIDYTVIFDGPYIKQEHVICNNIDRLTVRDNVMREEAVP